MSSDKKLVCLSTNAAGIVDKLQTAYLLELRNCGKYTASYLYKNVRRTG